MIASALAMAIRKRGVAPISYLSAACGNVSRTTFQNSEKRHKFFAAIDAYTKRFQQDMIFCQAHAALYCKQADPPDLLWDDTLAAR